MAFDILIANKQRGKRVAGKDSYGSLFFKASNLFLTGILFFCFYLCVTPLGLLMRVFGRDDLHLKIDPEADSYWSAPDQGRQK